MSNEELLLEVGKIKTSINQLGTKSCSTHIGIQNGQANAMIGNVGSTKPSIRACWGTTLSY